MWDDKAYTWMSGTLVGEGLVEIVLTFGQMLSDLLCLVELFGSLSRVGFLRGSKCLCLVVYSCCWM